MRKIHGWDRSLLAYIERTRAVPFQWGVQDCALWAAGAVDVMYNTQIVRGLSPDYTDAASAATWMDERGWATVCDAARVFLDKPRVVSPAFAQRGDVACLVSEDGVWPRGTLMIVVGEDLVGPDVEGLRTVKLLAAARAGLTLQVLRPGGTP